MDTHRTGRVVVGVDNTLSGLQALRRAVAEARARKVPLHAVRCWNPGPAGMHPMLHNQRQEEAAAESQVVARAFADILGGLPDDLTIETVLIPAAAGPALVRHAGQDGDLLVVGTGRHRRWHRLSSTVRHCLAEAGCPVLVVPPPPLARNGSPRALLRRLRHDIEQLEQLAGDGSAG